MPAAGHDHVHVHFGARVFFVRKVQQDTVIHNPDARGRNRINERRTLQDARSQEAFERQRQRHECSGDGRGPRSAIGLNHVTIQPHGALSQRFLVCHRTQGAANQSLNLDCPPRLLPPRRFTRRAVFGRARQHAVFAGDPAFAATLEKSRHAIVDGRGANHARISQFDQHTSFRVLDVVRRDEDGTERVRGAAVSSWFR